MKYIIMAAGKGTRWNNYLGIPKHLIEINGETLLARTTRLLKENDINYVITGSDERYAQYGTLIRQTNNDCEIDRFEESIEGDICYLYGDVYYSEDAIKKIIETPVEDVLFFGALEEIFAVKVKDRKFFFAHKHRVKQLYLDGVIHRCIGWEVYRSICGISFIDHLFGGRYVLIDDETNDIDYPEDYEKFVESRK